MFPDPIRSSRRRLIASILAAVAGASLPGVAAAAREKADATDEPTLLVLGDSLSAEYGLRRGSGWVALVAQRLSQRKPAWSVVNASVSGETTAGGRSRIDALLERHAPRLVVVELGGNDALRGLDLRSTEANLDAIVGAAQRAGARVLVLGMQVPPNYGPAYADAFAAIFPKVAKRHDAALVPFFLEPIALEPKFFQPDRIHPTEDAQAALLDQVWPAIEALLGAPASASLRAAPAPLHTTPAPN